MGLYKNNTEFFQERRSIAGLVYKFLDQIKNNFRSSRRGGKFSLSTNRGLLFCVFILAILCFISLAAFAFGMHFHGEKLNIIEFHSTLPDYSIVISITIKLKFLAFWQDLFFFFFLFFK